MSGNGRAAASDGRQTRNRGDARRPGGAGPSRRGAVGLERGEILGYTARMAYDERLTVDPGKRGGKVCIRGTRVTVIEVLESLGSGMTQEQTLANFPDLRAADIQACLEYAADRERKMVKIPRE